VSPPSSILKTSSGRKQEIVMPDPLCPNCSRKYVKRVHRENILERVLSIFFIYPFRCQLCGHRFGVRQPGVKYVRIDEDRRTYERFSISFPIGFGNHQIDSQGSVTDISMGGCAMQTDARLAVGEIIRVSLEIPNEFPVTVDAALVRVVHGGRVGLEFLKFQESERKHLQDFIYTLLFSRRPAPPAGIAANTGGSAAPEPSRSHLR
jgi:PilZ domain